jgi:hypothetical protein
MADMSKLKRRTLPAPPPPDEASPNLRAPEHAPAVHPSGHMRFATRVTPEFDARIRAIAERDGLLLVEVMEQALEAYEAAR